MTYRYADLVHHREFRALWLGSALGVAATTMSSLTLGTLVYAQTGSALLTAVTMFGPSLVQVAGASTLMSAADTTPPRPVLTIVAVVMATALVTQALFDFAPGMRLVVVLVAAYVMSIGNGVRWGLLSQVLPVDQYAVARSAMNVSVGVMQIVGFAVGGSLLHVMSVPQVFWLAAAVAATAVPITWTGIDDRPPRRERRTGPRETWRGNRLLLGTSSTRALLVALCVPNGLVAGCEALFVPYAGDAAAPLFVAGATGMLAGDLLTGRVLTQHQRDESAAWLRIWLAIPFLAFLAHPGVPLAAVLAGVACLGYAASLAQQEALVRLTPPALAGQVLGAESAVRVTCQGLGAVFAGTLAGAMDVGNAMALLALASLCVSVLLTRGLKRAARLAREADVLEPALTSVG
jgi:predicted MFS family arabinose efflux permease